jgi:hypothetical protein
MKLESTGCPDSKRIVDSAGKCLGLCERYTSGMWAVHSAHNHNQLGLARHTTPTKAMRWFEDSYP